jgi:hypothetical protein
LGTGGKTLPHEKLKHLELKRLPLDGGIMFENEIITCLEQKVILLTKVLDLTKQIQVRSRQDDIKLDNFLELRGSFMQRVKKCDDLFSKLTEQMPPEQQERMMRILNSAIAEQDSTKEELLILALSKKCNTLLQRTDSLNTSAYEAIKEQWESVKEKLYQLRKEGKTPSMFFNHH